MIVEGIECPACQDAIWSRHRHDFRYCGCGATFVDGGRDYLRWGTSAEMAKKVPKIVNIDTITNEVVSGPIETGGTVNSGPEDAGA